MVDSLGPSHVNENTQKISIYDKSLEDFSSRKGSMDVAFNHFNASEKKVKHTHPDFKPRNELFKSIQIQSPKRDSFGKSPEQNYRSSFQVDGPKYDILPD